MKPLISAILITILASGSGLISSAMADEHGGHGMHHGHNSWMTSLTDKQTKQINKLKLEYEKQVYPIRAKIKQARVELGMLIIADKPRQKDIDNKIDNIVKLKAQKMRLKIAHKIEIRKILTEDQRVQFDKRVLDRFSRDKKGHGRGHHSMM